MKKILLLIFLLTINISIIYAGEAVLESDTYKTDKGDLKITFVGHASLIFEFDNMVIHVDPFSRAWNYDNLAKADMIIITHHHADHLDPELIKKLRKPGAPVITPELSSKNISDCIIIKNGESKRVNGIEINAIPAYNIIHKRDNGDPYHKKGEGNGYILNMGGKKVYIAGDTENTPEMKELKNIDIAFLPMNLPYTMTEEMVADAA
ncbi:MAG: MBL fold metallo-hydrolase, partial [Candidatus Aminicenantes bacterium]|nr:MBL fold metallo-hydrolase [Candidatus Aminicenantes bacterium]